MQGPGAALRAADVLGARDCGWLEQMRPFVRHYSLPGELVLDPFCGFGTTLLAAEQEGRRGLGFEVDPERVAWARERLAQVCAAQVRPGSIDRSAVPPVDLCLTSVPYFGCNWPGAGRDRAQLYQAADYSTYLAGLRRVFHAVRSALREGRHCIVMAQNLELAGRFVPLAWDVGRLLGELFMLKQERLLLYRQPSRELEPLADASNRAHEYALVCMKQRERIDVHAARALLEAMVRAGLRFAVHGSFGAHLRGANGVPGDLDLVVGCEGLNPMLWWLVSRGFEVRSWGEAVPLPVDPLAYVGRYYFRARRLGSDGSLLQVDVVHEVEDATPSELLARAKVVDGFAVIEDS